jgi:hypothetical protein
VISQITSKGGEEKKEKERKKRGEKDGKEKEGEGAYISALYFSNFKGTKSNISENINVAIHKLNVVWCLFAFKNDISR